MTLTSQKLIFEKEKGLFKKERELIDTVPLDSVKVYNDVAQIKQKNATVEVQTVDKNVSIVFSGMLDARRFSGKIVDAVTGTTLARRSSNKIKDAFNMVDDTLGLDTRGAIKGILENRVRGTIVNGLGKKSDVQLGTTAHFLLFHIYNLSTKITIKVRIPPISLVISGFFH